MQTLLLATQNPGKVREYQALLADLPLQVISLADAGIDLDVDETGTTFAENAILKAQIYAGLGQSTLDPLWTWADDSGLEVDALGGAPGVYSARYAGPNATDEDRWRKLLADLSALPDADPARWTARFRCVVALVGPDGSIHTTEGTLEGKITATPRGDNGFGYDPIFLLPQEGKTLAELPSHHKNLISHRGQAAARARSLLVDLLIG